MNINETLTIEEVARELKVPREQVFNMFAYGINGLGPALKPSVLFRVPVTMIDVSQYKEDCLSNKIDPIDIKSSHIQISGLFQIRNYTKVFDEIEKNHGYLNFQDIPLCRNDRVFLVQSYVKIHKSDLVIESKELNQFITRHGIIRGEPAQVRKSAAAQELKKLQTIELDANIEKVCDSIKKAVDIHFRSGGRERIVNHALFVDEAGFSQGNERKRALKLVCEFIKSSESGIAWQGYKYATHPVKKGSGYFF